MENNYKVKRFTVSLRSLFICIMLLLMLLSDLMKNILPDFIGYTDEFLAVLSIFIVNVYLLNNRLYRKKNITFYLMFAGIIVIGLLGNLISGLQNWKAALYDVFFFIKPYIIYLMIHVVITEKSAKQVFEFMMKI